MLKIWEFVRGWVLLHGGDEGFLISGSQVGIFEQRGVPYNVYAFVNRLHLDKEIITLGL